MIDWPKSKYQKAVIVDTYKEAQRTTAQLITRSVHFEGKSDGHEMSLNSSASASTLPSKSDA